MNIGKAVGFVMLIALMTYAAITLFGRLGPLSAGVLFFIISSLILTMTVLIYRPVLKKDTGYVVFQIIIICAALSCLIGIARLYQNTIENNSLAVQNAAAEADYISSVNDYYSSYITYLDGELARYNLSNAMLDAQIAEVRSMQAGSPAVQQTQDVQPAEQQPTTNTTIQTVPRYEEDDRYEHEREGYDD